MEKDALGRILSQIDRNTFEHDALPSTVAKHFEKSQGPIAVPETLQYFKALLKVPLQYLNLTMFQVL